MPVTSLDPIASNQCYRDVKLSSLTDDLLDMVAQRALAAQQHGHIIEHEWTWSDQLRFWPGWRQIPQLHDIAADCLVPCKVGVQLLPPGVFMPVHTDGTHTHWRCCSIATVLWPQRDIPSTHWYQTLDSTEPAVTADWRLHQSKLINVTTPHGGIQVGDQWRITLQISFATSFAETVALINSEQLFRTARCDWE